MRSVCASALLTVLTWFALCGLLGCSPGSRLAGSETGPQAIAATAPAASAATAAAAGGMTDPIADPSVTLKQFLGGNPGEYRALEDQRKEAPWGYEVVRQYRRAPPDKPVADLPDVVEIELLSGQVQFASWRWHYEPDACRAKTRPNGDTPPLIRLSDATNVAIRFLHAKYPYTAKDGEPQTRFRSGSYPEWEATFEGRGPSEHQQHSVVLCVCALCGKPKLLTARLIPDEPPPATAPHVDRRQAIEIARASVPASELSSIDSIQVMRLTQRSPLAPGRLVYEIEIRGEYRDPSGQQQRRGTSRCIDANTGERVKPEPVPLGWRHFTPRNGSK